MKNSIVWVALECFAVLSCTAIDLSSSTLGDTLRNGDGLTLKKGMAYPHVGSDVRVTSVMAGRGVLASCNGRMIYVTTITSDYKDGDVLGKGFYIYEGSLPGGENRVEKFAEATKEDKAKILQTLKRQQALEEGTVSEQDIEDRLKRSRSLSFKRGTPNNVLGVKFTLPLKWNKTRDLTVLDFPFYSGKRYKEIHVAESIEQGKGSELFSATRTVYGTARSHLTFLVKCNYIGEMDDVVKMISEAYGSKAVPYTTPTRKGERRSSFEEIKAYQLVVGDVIIYVTDNSLVAVNIVLLELAVEESEAEKDKSHNANLDILTGGGQESEAKKKSVVIPGFRGYKFGQKYSATRMTAEMRQEGGLAIKPVSISYRKFRTIELGYAINGKRLCNMKLCAEFPTSVEDEILKDEMEKTKDELERQLGFEMTEEGDAMIYEDDNYTVKLWIQAATKTVRSSQLVGLHKRTVMNTVDVKGLYLLMVDKRLMPKD